MLKQRIKTAIVKLIGWMMTFRPALPMFNFLFEYGSSGFRSFVIRNVKQQPVNYLWKVKLLNNKTFNVFIDDSWKSWQFAYNYKWYHIGDSKVMRLLNDYYPIDGTYIDIGANLGLMTMHAVAAKRRMVLFEPNKSLNAFTQKQYSANNYSNYVIENYCLSDHEGTATFYVSGSSFQSSLNKNIALADKYGGLAGEMNVELTTLDKYLSARPDIKPVIIKIDAEGHDFEVLKGAEKTIREFQPAVFVEINSVERPDIINFMESLGFKSFGVSRLENDYLIRPERKKEFDDCLDALFVRDKVLLDKIASFIK